MFGEHNKNTTQEKHKAIAYKISNPKILKQTSLEFLKEIKESLNIHLPTPLKEFVIFHPINIPVDTMTAEELLKYTTIPNENPNLRQPTSRLRRIAS